MLCYLYCTDIGPKRDTTYHDQLKKQDQGKKETGVPSKGGRETQRQRKTQNTEERITSRKASTIKLTCKQTSILFAQTLKKHFY